MAGPDPEGERNLDSGPLVPLTRLWEPEAYLLVGRLRSEGIRAMVDPVIHGVLAAVHRGGRPCA